MQPLHPLFIFAFVGVAHSRGLHQRSLASLRLSSRLARCLRQRQTGRLAAARGPPCNQPYQKGASDRLKADCARQPCSALRPAAAQRSSPLQSLTM
jgi:hypothetical protein